VPCTKSSDAHLPFSLFKRWTDEVVEICELLLFWCMFFHLLCLSLSGAFTCCAHNGIRYRKGIRILFRLNIGPLPLLLYKISTSVLFVCLFGFLLITCRATPHPPFAVHISKQWSCFILTSTSRLWWAPNSELSTSLNYLNPLPSHCGTTSGNSERAHAGCLQMTERNRTMCGKPQKPVNNSCKHETRVGLLPNAKKLQTAPTIPGRSLEKYVNMMAIGRIYAKSFRSGPILQPDAQCTKHHA